MTNETRCHPKARPITLVDAGATFSTRWIRLNAIFVKLLAVMIVAGSLITAVSLIILMGATMNMNKPVMEFILPGLWIGLSLLIAWCVLTVLHYWMLSRILAR